MTNFNYDNYDDDTKAKYDDGIEFLDDDFSFDEDDDDDNIYDIPRYSDEPVAPHHHKEKQEETPLMDFLPAFLYVNAIFF